MPKVSVVIPTYNEGANIGPLLEALELAFAGVEAEFVVVDDNSKDGTAEKARLASRNARVIVRTEERGLATAVARGIAESRGTFVAVMDADFQHPPQSVRALYDRAEATAADLVVGSRYAAGGTEGQFGAMRRRVSHSAAYLARLALPPVRQHGITDPMSGLFLVRRDRVDVRGLRPQGYKILLELLARCEFRRVEEVGYRFDTRRDGASKLGGKVLLQYVLHLAALGVWHPENQRAIRFVGVGFTGVAVNLAALFLLDSVAGWDALAAQVVAIELSILSNFLLNDRFTFADRHKSPFLARMGLFHLVSLAGALVNLSVFFVLTYLVGLHYLLASLVGVVAGFSTNYLYNLRYTYGSRSLPRKSTWVPMLALVVVGGSLYLGGLDGIHDVYFDEHYYLSVAHQLDNGVLEDPCWTHDARLADRPLNYEHPPLAKEILWASVHAYDTYKGTFLGCRAPDDKNTKSEPCFDEGTVQLYTGQECYQAFTNRMRDLGNPWAWRTPSAVFGVATILFTGLAARRLLRSDLAGALAGSFVLLDNLILSSSRIALLDIFATGFTAVALYCATFPSKKGVILTSLFLGLGFSCKYYVLFAAPAILVVSLWMHARAARLTKRRFDLHFLSYAAIAFSVWVATWTPWWILWFRTKGFLGAIVHWGKVQGAAIGWDVGVGVNGDQGHQYQSKPAEWILLRKPMSYIGPGTPFPDGNFVASYIYAVGNPAVWWSAALAVLAIPLLFAGGWAVRLARGWESPFRYFTSLERMKQALIVSCLLPVSAYGGFFALNRTTYIFYMTIVVPMLAVVLAGSLAYLARRAGGRVVVAAVGLLALAGFLWYLPVSLYIPIPRDGFMWMHQDLGDLSLFGHRIHFAIDYPGFGFHRIMRLLPTMHEYGSWECWSGKTLDVGAACL